MNDGITLTSDGRSWVSVSNPLRGDSSGAVARARATQAPEFLSARSGIGAVFSATLVGALTALAGMPPLLAVLLAILVLPASWLVLYRHMEQLAGNLASAVDTEGLGPRRILRSDFLPGERANAADAVAMGAVRILQSSSYRCGALGGTDAVYRDVLDSVWALLWKLRTLEEETVEGARLAAPVENGDADEQTRADAVELHATTGRAWTQQLQPDVIAHRQLVDAVAELDRLLDTPHARDRAGELDTTPDFALRHSHDLEALARRVAAVLELARTGRDQPPGIGPGGNTTAP